MIIAAALCTAVFGVPATAAFDMGSLALFAGLSAALYAWVGLLIALGCYGVGGDFAWPLVILWLPCLLSDRALELAKKLYGRGRRA